MRVVRIYHGGRDTAHRERERALVRAGADVTVVIPAIWPGGSEELETETFDVVQLPVLRAGDRNRHRFADPSTVADLVGRLRPDVVDLHEEPFSSVVHQVLRRLPLDQSVVTYAAQNIDKRFPPPFAQWEERALRRVQGIYPCTRQAASVVVGKGFSGAVRVLPLAPPSNITLGAQRPPSKHIRMLLAGRLVPEKGVLDAVRVLAEVRRRCPATLLLSGAGPEAEPARKLATDLGVANFLEILPWAGPAELATRYREAHVLLAPSRSTRTWVEQFGRMVVEAQAAGAVVVGYATGSLPEVVGNAGVLVPEGNYMALAHAVLELHERLDTWFAMRNAGLTLAADRTWDTVAAGQIALYGEAVEAPHHTERVRPQRGSALLRYGEPALLRYGEPARIAGGGRPFALPILRTDTAATRLLARIIDSVARNDHLPPPSRFRVVYVNHIARLSGGEKALARLISSLPRVEAHVILGEDGPLREVLQDAGATVEIFPLDPGLRDTRRAQVGAGAGGIRSAVLTLGYTVRLARRLRALQPDIVHTNSLKAGFYGSLAARLAGRPVIWHLRDRIADDYLPAAAVRLTRLALKYLPDVVVCNSEATLRASGVELKSTGDGGRIIPSPYRPSGGARMIRSGDFVVGIVGRLAPWKGQDVFVRAFAAAYQDRPDIRGRIIGSAMFDDDAYEQSLRSLVGELNLDGRITFTGFSEDVESELAQLDVLVHASVVAEPFGQVVVEGMAAGLPVVATAAGGPMEIISDEIDGLLVKPGDTEELAAALRRLASEPELRSGLGSAAARRAKDFDPEPVGQKMQAVYQDLLAGRKNPARPSDGRRPHGPLRRSTP